MVTYVCARYHTRTLHVYCNDVSVHCDTCYITGSLYSQWSYVLPYAMLLFRYIVSGVMLYQVTRVADSIADQGFVILLTRSHQAILYASHKKGLVNTHMPWLYTVQPRVSVTNCDMTTKAVSREDSTTVCVLLCMIMLKIADSCSPGIAASCMQTYRQHSPPM